MKAQQIALKPFLHSLASRGQKTYGELLDQQALQSVDHGDRFLSSPFVRGNIQLASVLRANSAQVEEIHQELEARNANPRATQSFISAMLVTALALDPLAAAGLDTCAQIIQCEEPPLEKSCIENGELTLGPALQRIAREVDTDVAGMLGEAAQAILTNPVNQITRHRDEASIATASIFRVKAEDVQELQATLEQSGLNPLQRDALASRLILSAAAYEPTLRTGFQQVLNLYLRNERPMQQSVFQQMA